MSFGQNDHNTYMSGERLMFLEITHYYAKPGQAAAVLIQRRAATALRVQLGLPPGETFTKVEGEGPDVRWECRFENRSAYERDLAARGASPATRRRLGAAGTGWLVKPGAMARQFAERFGFQSRRGIGRVRTVWSKRTRSAPKEQPPRNLSGQRTGPTRTL
jgi:hypothetical protein